MPFCRTRLSAKRFRGNAAPLPNVSSTLTGHRRRQPRSSSQTRSFAAKLECEAQVSDVRRPCADDTHLLLNRQE